MKFAFIVLFALMLYACGKPAQQNQMTQQEKLDILIKPYTKPIPTVAPGGMVFRHVFTPNTKSK